MKIRDKIPQGFTNKYWFLILQITIQFADTIEEQDSLSENSIESPTINILKGKILI